MTGFISAQAKGEQWRQVVEDCVHALPPLPEGEKLGFMYATDALAGNMREMVQHLREETGVDHWVGTVGIGICGDETEYYDEPSIAVMVGGFPHDTFRVFTTVDTNLNNFERLHNEWCRRNTACLGLIHGDPRAAATADLIPRLGTALPQCFLVGGLSSSQTDHPQVADVVCEGGISGVLFSDRVNVAMTLSQGCSPIALPHEITACRDNVVLELDGKPELEVFKEDIGEILARDLQRVGGYIFVGLPIEGSDTGDYVVRNLLGVDLQQKSIIVGDICKPHGKLMFCKRDSQTAWEDLHQSLQSLKSRIDGQILGGIYISCLGRGRYLFGEDSEELKIIHRELGNFPLAGFFANGEITHNQLYGYTGVLTLFLADSGNAH